MHDPNNCHEEDDIEDDNHEDYYYNFIEKFDKQLIEFESEISLHTILQEDKLNEFKEFCKINKDLSLLECIKKFKENS